VARDGAYLVFVEVKGRQDEHHGSGFEAVTFSKRRKVVRAAQAFAAARGLSETPIRFDVIAVEWGEGDVPRIDHAPSAFDSDGA
jgi:putative endonuclease